MTGQDRGGVGGVDEPGPSEVLPQPGVRHGQVDLGVPVVEGIRGRPTRTAALSIDLQTSGTAAQGIFLNNDGLDDFVVKGTGRIGVGIDRAATPRAQVHIVQRADAPAALHVEGTVRVADTAAPPTFIDSTGGGALYAVGGELMWRGSNGTVTRLAPA